MIAPAKRPLRSMLHLQMGQEVLYLLMTIGIMASLILLVYAHSVSPEPQNNPVALQQRITMLQAELAALQSQVAQNEQPPIITLSEAQGYYFASGSSALNPAFCEALTQTIVPRILEISTRYKADVIEVVGHTDEVPVHNGHSTVDLRLLDFLNRRPSAAPVAADNVGLGMARAAAVVRELRTDPRLKDLTILPLSAGQTTTVRHQLSAGIDGVGQEEERRRIEVRVRRRFSS